MTDNLNNTPEIKEEAPKKKALTLKIIDKPVRNLPKLIGELLNKNFSVVLTQNGYYIEGFYGIQQNESFKGYIFAQETTEDGTLAFFDAKGHKHYIKTFEELASLNSIVWGQFYKTTDEYKKPNAKWFGFMLELGVLNITPNK